MKDLKYLIAYAIPIAVVIGLHFKGIWSFFTPVFAFIIIPIIETILPENEQNLDTEEVEKKKNKLLFDVLLYLNLPIIYGLIIWSLWSLTIFDYELYEIFGLTFSVGIALGSNGINVAHELGHRKTFWERTLGKILLLPALYMHFYIEHNFGHHLHAATKEDPASAKYNQSVYSFWVTSIIGQYISAWKIQWNLLINHNKSFVSFKNDMLWYACLLYTSPSPRDA